MTPKIITAPIVFGKTYRVGSCGWTHDGILGDAISYGERWERNPGYPKVSHAFIFVGDGKIIEAGPDGIVLASLDKYLNDSKCAVYSRDVLGLGLDGLGERIAASAMKKIGEPYDYPLLAVDAFKYTLLGHLLCKIPRLGNWLADAIGSEKGLICSELASFALNDQPELKGHSILSTPLNCIDPQALIQGESLFTDIIYSKLPCKS